MEKFLIEAKNTRQELIKLSSELKKKVLYDLADLIEDSIDEIINANNIDIISARKSGLSDALIDRLMLNKDRLYSLSNSVRTIADDRDYIGESLEEFKLKSGVRARKVIVPLGVVAIIYESRPNVTIDAAALCFKSSNVSILRGSASAINSNIVLAEIFEKALEANSLPKTCVNLIKDTNRSHVDYIIKANKYIDVLIPRGGKGLKEYINKNATIPVIETGAGICHLYIDKDIDLEMARNIAVNAKCQRPGTCNSIEMILFNRDIDINSVQTITDALLEQNVDIRYDKDIINALNEASYKNIKKIKIAKEEDFSNEFLSLTISAKFIFSTIEAIDYINKFGTHHSDIIVTNCNESAKLFLNLVDSSCVYHNASSRYSDGGEFGFGGEIGISTQMLHARGPMGIKELTTYKYILEGDGHVRDNWNG